MSVLAGVADSLIPIVLSRNITRGVTCHHTREDPTLVLHSYDSWGCLGTGVIDLESNLACYPGFVSVAILVRLILVVPQLQVALGFITRRRRVLTSPSQAHRLRTAGVTSHHGISECQDDQLDS